jgi:serine protease AprX
VLLPTSAGAATVAPALAATLRTAADADAVGIVIVTFHGQGSLDSPHVAVLQQAGVVRGLTLSRLRMVAINATAGQVRALAASPAVRSIWPNEPLRYFINEARVLTGVQKLRTDAALTRANGGLPFSGKGNFSLVINDSGIDGTHQDLKYPQHVVENVQVVTDPDTLSPTAPPGFTPLLFAEDVPNTDTHVGHGTHVAGIAGGTGQASGARYQGVAPGVNIIGTGSGAGLFILNALGGFQWALANQFQHNIRIISNSWGSSGEFDPDNPINVASHEAYANNIIVLFAAGNSGPGPDTHNPYAKAPWVISVGAGTKEGGLAAFSSRGLRAEERLGDNDPNNDSDAPTIVAPGTGREFDANAGRFTQAIVSVRSSTNVVANGADWDLEIPPAFVPFYTQIQGTSMATPFVAGVVALMLEADTTLSPDEVKQILRETATRMPGFEDYEAGAGYVNAYAAVDKVVNRNKAYGVVNNPSFNAGLTVAPLLPHETFEIDFDYVEETTQPAPTNAYPFDVAPGVGLLHVRVDFGTTAITAETGNVFFLILRDPDGNDIDSGASLPVLDSPRREILLKNPKPGRWVAWISAGYLGGVVPATVPERVNGLIKRYSVTLDPVPDIAGHAAEGAIITALASRLMDTFPDGTFRPDTNVTRADFARVLALTTPVRQSVGASPRFSDVSGEIGLIAEAVTANGSTLRDWDFTPAGMMSAGSTFNPDAAITRLDVAVAFVKAIGLDAVAKAAANTVVTSGGQALTDNEQIPAALRGYVQIALDRGLLEAFPAEVRQIAPGQFEVLPGPRFEPATLVTRATLASKIATFVQVFRAGP